MSQFIINSINHILDKNNAKEDIVFGGNILVFVPDLMYT